MLWMDEEFDKDMKVAVAAAKQRMMKKANGVRTFMAWDGEKYGAVVEELVNGVWMRVYPVIEKETDKDGKD